MAENPLQFPTIIQVQNSDESTNHNIMDGNLQKKSNTCILFEETTLWRKSSAEYTSYLLYHKPDDTRSFVVILFDKRHTSLVKQHNKYHARFFDNFNEAQRYYSCFTSIETGKKNYAET